MQAGNSADLAAPPGTSQAQGEKEERKPSGAEAPEQRDLFTRAQRRKLPDERKSITHKFAIGGHEGYIIVGMYEEGAPANSSSRWRKRARHCRASWMASRCRSPSASNTACR